MAQPVSVSRVLGTSPSAFADGAPTETMSAVAAAPLVPDAGRPRRIEAPALVAGLQPPSAPTATRTTDAFPTSLARDGLDIITQSYLDPLPALRLTAAGLNQLKLGDRALDVTTEDGALVLRWNGDVVARETPADASNAAYLAAARAIVNTAVARSPVLARFSGQELSQAFLAGMVSQLDKYSRAITAAELAQLTGALSTKAHGGTAAAAQVQPTAPSPVTASADEFPVLTVPSFTHTTAADIATALEPLVHRGVKGVVIDLRGSGGGDLEQSAAAADEFVERGVVLNMEARDPTYAKHLEAKVASPLEKLRIVILVDGGTASASELFAKTLGDLGRAVIVGHPTFAKGRAQAIIPMRTGEGLVLTVARFTGPTGAPIDEIGAVPAVCENAQGEFVDTKWAVADVRDTNKSASRAALLRVCQGGRSRDPREVAVAQRLLSDNAAFARAVSRQHRLAGTQNDVMNATTRHGNRY